MSAFLWYHPGKPPFHEGSEEKHMAKAKMQWTTPQLIVLARGTPDESVLTHCKTKNPNNPVSGPGQATQNTCATLTPDVSSCDNCQSRAMGS